MRVSISPTSPVAPPAFPVSHSPISPNSPHANPLPRHTEEAAQGPHAYRPPNGASRSPCPCLNALANHSYLPHDGRNITFSRIISALQRGMGLSRGFALFMAIGTFTLLRRPSLAPFDLHGTAIHNFIEHNASLVHDDAPPESEYAPTEVDLKLLNEFLDMAHPTEQNMEKVITESDIVARIVEREAACRPVDALHDELRRAEFAMVMEVFGKGKDKQLSKQQLDVFLREERIPDDWTPTHRLRLSEAISRSARIRHAVKLFKMSHHQEGSKGDGRVTEWFKEVVKRLTMQGSTVATS